MWYDGLWWNSVLEEYPVGSKWRCKHTGNKYTIEEIHDAGLHAMLELVNREDCEDCIFMPHPNMHLGFKRL